MSNTSHESLTQATYTETPYSDAEWEIVGEPPTEQTFNPVQIEVLKSATKSTDPLFADYGGYSAQKGKQQRWHLPEELALKLSGNAEAQEDRIARMVEENTASLAAMEKRAYATGHKAGVEEVEKKSQEHFKALSERMTGLLTDLNRQVQEQKAVTERQSVELAIELARQLTRATVEYNPEYILPIIKSGLEQAGGAMVRSVKVSKEDLEFLTLAGALAGLDGAGTKWHFVADDTVKSGCIVETTSGEIDLQIEAAFERAKNQILKAIR